MDCLASSQPRVSWTILLASPVSINETMRSVSYKIALSTLLKEFKFLTSTLVPSVFGSLETEIFASTRISPFSMLASEASKYQRMSWSSLANLVAVLAASSAVSKVCGSVTSSISGMPARLKSIRE